MDADRPFHTFVEVPHKADIAVDVFASNLAELFINAANGLYHILGVRTGTGEPEKLQLTIEEIDDESLLVSFLSELLYYVEQEKAAVDFQFVIEKHKLEAEMLFLPLVSTKVEIKAVTYNELVIKKSSQGLQTRIVFDI